MLVSKYPYRNKLTCKLTWNAIKFLMKGTKYFDFDLCNLETQWGHSNILLALTLTVSFYSCSTYICQNFVKTWNNLTYFVMLLLLCYHSNLNSVFGAEECLLYLLCKTCSVNSKWWHHSGQQSLGVGWGWGGASTNGRDNIIPVRNSSGERHGGRT